MSNDLRANFKERHYKCLYEAIDMVPLPTKKACPKKARKETGNKAPSTPMPLLDVMGPSSVPAVEEEAGLAPGGGGVSDGIAPVEEVSDQKDTYTRFSS